MKVLSRIEIDRIRHAWRTSDLKAEIMAADFGIARSTLIRHTRDMSRRGQHDDVIRRLADKGMNPTQIAKRVPITRPAIARKLKMWGLR